MAKAVSGLIQAGSDTMLVNGIGIDQYEPPELRREDRDMLHILDLVTGILRENLMIG